MPVSAEILACNDAVDATPELLNSDPYGEGWLLKIKLLEPAQVAALLQASAYAELI